MLLFSISNIPILPLNEVSFLNNLFKNETSFKGKIGIFDIENNKINHRLNFYKIEDSKIKKIF